MPARCRRQVRAATWQDVRVPRRTLADRPTTRRTVLAGLLGTAGAAVTACIAATTRYAGLLGSIAAARATHLEVLS